jgi:uncharacterized protein YjbI with pentapeptide repeats
MSQDQHPQPPEPWWKDHWAVLALVALSVLIATVTFLGYWQRWAWTGLETKSAWDWLELLIIPVILAAGAFWFNTQSRRRELEQEFARRKSEQELAFQARESERELAQRERENDRHIAEDRVREEALQRYLDRMQELIIDKGLRRSEKDAEIRDVARARTLTVLRSLDGNRKGQVVRFLHEADLIGKSIAIDGSGERQLIEAIIDLRTADLSSAILRSADLSGAILSGAILGGANLSHANLNYANLFTTYLGFANLSFARLSFTELRGIILEDADLRYAQLNSADLSFANLRRADLKDVNLTNANLSDPSLTDFNVSYTDLTNANLRGTNLRGAKGWTNQQLLIRATSR